MGLRDAYSWLTAKLPQSAVAGGLRNIAGRVSNFFHPEEGFVLHRSRGVYVISMETPNQAGPNQVVVTVATLPPTPPVAPTPHTPEDARPRAPRVAPVDAADAARAVAFRPIHVPQRGNAVPEVTGEPVSRRLRDVPVAAAPVVVIPGNMVTTCIVSPVAVGPRHYCVGRARVVDWLLASSTTVGGWAPASSSAVVATNKLGSDKGIDGCSEKCFELVAPPSTRASHKGYYSPAGAGLPSSAVNPLPATTSNEKSVMHGVWKVGPSRFAHCFESASLDW
eukprot:TRINITY_DN6809_c0_g1_i1.p1 TRINITY_DN6809_c0_g1~~TRINITY_DN6809_c0_g1_i1.p1  ORF type:complete len:279 (-),score=47.61 TRINITY_DN6809_c0_g1_i1:276-1112(-)